MKESIELILEDTPANRENLFVFNKIELLLDKEELYEPGQFINKIDEKMEFGKKYRLTVESI